MITKQQYIDSVCFEFNVIRHLGSKVQADTFEFRPTPKQRSMHELMHFLTTIFGYAVDSIKQGTSTPDTEWKHEQSVVTLENFNEHMKKEEDYFRKVVGEMSEDDLNEEVEIFGRTQTRALHLLNGPIKWASAYKLQLFMYLKMTGQTHLNTMNLWAGMDPMPKE
jgi:hypothetical protein